MKELLLLNPEQVTVEEVNTYKVRRAVRAVVVDDQRNIALLFVAKEKYYKLPGGGIEGDEEPLAALRRECQEEIGVDIDVIAEIGEIVEYRKFERLKQTSYCYFARAQSRRGATELTPEEKQRGFQSAWLTFDEAKRMLRIGGSTYLEANKYIIPRDKKFLKAAEHLFDQSRVPISL